LSRNNTVSHNGRGPINACIVSLVGSGRATTRIALARALKLTPSTISFHVNQLLEDGVVFDAEVGTEFHNNAGRGRPARRLRLTGDGSSTLAIDLGGQRVHLGVLSVIDEIQGKTLIGTDVARGPVAVLEQISDEAEALLATQPATCVLRAIGMSVPGPVDVTTGAIVMPSRMPGWAGFNVRDWLEHRFGVPVAVENDANAMAYGEYLARPESMGSTVTVKAGAGIGTGIMIDGRLHRGATFGAGDIAHVRVPQAGDTPCSCGNRGCLETVASGAALVETLMASGVPVETTTDVVALAQAGHPVVTTACRTAGAVLGQVLCTVANFLNPTSMFIGGQLAAIEPFVAAVRSQIYQGAHPIATQDLVIEKVRSAEEGTLVGMSHLAFETGWDRSAWAEHPVTGDDLEIEMAEIA
jgi:predicted NBD/HSP70 family sugar kinase